MDGTRTLPQVLDLGRTGITLDECAAAARSRGFPVFALQGNGQCFFGSMSDIAFISSSLKLLDDSCSSLPCAASDANCPGMINKVYVLIGARAPLEFMHIDNFRDPLMTWSLVDAQLYSCVSL
jgi:hypothetical protein